MEKIKLHKKIKNVRTLLRSAFIIQGIKSKYEINEKFLQEYDIIVQYIIRGTPKQMMLLSFVIHSRRYDKENVEQLNFTRVIMETCT